MLGFLSKFGGKVIAEPIEAIGNVIDKVSTSDEERLQGQAVLEKIKQNPMILQAEINKLEAQHRSTWVAGARPFILWICGIGLGVYFIPKFILAAFLWTKSCLISGQIVPYPVDGKDLMDLVVALLGLGLYRTVEKFGNKTK